MYFYILQTCAIPVTEMATPWAEYTLLLVTWRVIVFSINLWRQRRYTTLCYPIYILNAIFVLYDIIPSIRFLVKSSFLTYVVFKRHPIIECYKQYLDLVRKTATFHEIQEDLNFRDSCYPEIFFSTLMQEYQNLNSKHLVKIIRRRWPVNAKIV